jgi:hypothetical protein
MKTKFITIITILVLIPFCSIGQNLPDLTSEQSFRDYFEKNGTDLIEGIWDYAGGINSYRLAIIKEGYKFNAYVLERSGKFSPGDLKATFEPAASDQVVSINWLMGDKSNQKTVGKVTNNTLIEFNLSGNSMLYRLYPKIDEKSKTKKVKTGEWSGNGSGLTGIASNLAISGSTGNGSVALQTQALSILGTANEVETSVTSQTVTIGLPDDVTIGRDLTVTRNLTVFGTASFQNTENLLVADRFILLASGSASPGDGGIVIQQGTQNVGEAFAFDNDTKRWAVTGSFNATQAVFAPDAFMAAALNLAAPDPNATSPDAKYNKKGNIYVSTANEDIWIYS